LSASHVNLNDEEVKYFANSLRQNVINTLLTKLAQGKAPIDRSFRLGGMVAVGSFKREDLKSTFDVTDYKNKFSIEYTGILPDLFREGQGIITTGSLVNGRFIATEVLASWRIKIIAIITECLK
jgi:cytochrome c-type biogenesis protein CcmE